MGPEWKKLGLRRAKLNVIEANAAKRYDRAPDGTPAKAGAMRDLNTCSMIREDIERDEAALFERDPEGLL